ncbi:MAG: hypothetical protein IMF11_18185 [Proteobacteria bacterium]|nr:hypothetical protein [Pseudomonadota bacterium]
MKMIRLKNSNSPCFVDSEDFNWINIHIWNSIKGRNGVEYAISNIKREDGWHSIRMHRMILGITDPKIFVDHKDHIGLNNQRHNLRPVTNLQNILNPKVPYSGAYYHKRDKCWRAKICIDHKQIHLGSFKDDEEAAREAYRLRFEERL